MMLKKLFCILSVTVIVCLSQPVYAESQEQPAQTVESKSAESAKRWEKNMQEFRKWDSKNSFPKDAVLFVGSSSIVGWPTRESFPDLPVINRGFGGSIYSDIFFHADTVIFQYDPRVIVFYSGDNDPFWGKTPEQIVDDFKQIMALVRGKYPKTPVIVMATKICESRIDREPGYTKANQMLKEMADSDELLYYFDSVTPLLGKDGKPNPDYFLSDKLHLNAKGYAAWSENIKPLLVKLVSYEIKDIKR